MTLADTFAFKQEDAVSQVTCILNDLSYWPDV